MDMDIAVEKDLIEYVTEQHLTSKSKERIKQFCQKQPLQSRVVYRGHANSNQIRESIWYSATSSYQVAKEEFAGKTGCVFKIHLINVPVIDINLWIGDKISKYNEEDEIIFLGGGTFYTNERKNEKGVTDKGNGLFECWYTLEPSSPTSASSLDVIFNQIPEEEYDMINSYHDIVGFNISDTEKQQIFDKIQKKWK